MELSEFVESIWVGLDHEVPFQVTVLPTASTATQNVELVHEMELSELVPSISVAADQEVPLY